MFKEDFIIKSVKQMGDYFCDDTIKHAPSKILTMPVRYADKEKSKPYGMFSGKSEFCTYMGIDAVAGKKLVEGTGTYFNNPVILTAPALEGMILFDVGLEKELSQNDLTGIWKPNSGIGNIFANDPSLMLDGEEYIVIESFSNIAYSFDMQPMTLKGKLKKENIQLIDFGRSVKMLHKDIATHLENKYG